MPSTLRHALILMDYDGTVTEDDGYENLLDTAVGPAWRESEEQLKRGEITHTEAFRRQIAMMPWPRERIFATVAADAVVRPGLREFLSQVLEDGARVAVVSAGFREAIETVWQRMQLPPVEIYASELLGDPHRGYEVVFHPLASECPRCDKCKAGVLDALRRPGDFTIVFGDGDGDYCMAREADLVFARRHLATLLEREGVPYCGLVDYHQALTAIRDCLAASTASGAEVPCGS